MDKQFEEGNVSPTSQQTDATLIALIKEMQQQLVSLEQKLDDLIQQSSERSYQEKSFPKPFRPYGQSHRPEGRREGGPPRDRSFPPGRRFDRPQGEGRPGGRFERPQGEGRRDSGPREGNFPPGRRFDRPQGGGNRGFGPRRKKF